MFPISLDDNTGYRLRGRFISRAVDPPPRAAGQPSAAIATCDPDATTGACTTASRSSSTSLRRTSGAREQAQALDADGHEPHGGGPRKPRFASRAPSSRQPSSRRAARRQPSSSSRPAASRPAVERRAASPSRGRQPCAASASREPRAVRRDRQPCAASASRPAASRQAASVSPPAASRRAPSSFRARRREGAVRHRPAMRASQVAAKGGDDERAVDPPVRPDHRGIAVLRPPGIEPRSVENRLEPLA